MDEDFFDRLDKYMEFKCLNDNKVTVQTGIPVGSLGKQRKGARGLSANSIAKILCVYEDLNADWLITGRGEMLKKNSDEKQTHEMELIEKLEEAREEIGYYKGILMANGLSPAPFSKKGNSA